MRRIISATLLAIAITSCSGCLLPIYDADPNVRAEQLINAAEDLRSLRSAWHRLWFTDQPDHQKPIRTHGGII